MAMHFTVHPVRLASSLLLLLHSCTSPEPSFPLVYKQANDTGLHRHEGFLYDGTLQFSGYLFDLYANGDTAATGRYVGGKEEGWQRQWYAKDRLMEERYYHLGKKEGLHRGWWPDGRPKFSYRFANDEYEGERAEWDEAGQLYRKMHYTAGREEGLQQLWWPDGKLRANYIMKNDRAYGLIGRKLCVNDDTTKPVR